MLLPERIDSSPEVSQVPSPAPPADQARPIHSTVDTMGASLQSSVYENTTRPSEVRPGLSGEVKKLFENIDKEDEMEKRLDTLSVEIEEDRKILEECSLKTEKERLEHRKKIYVHVQARDQEGEKIRKELEKLIPGVHQYGGRKKIDFTNYNKLQDEEDLLDEENAEIVRMEENVAGMKKRLSEKEARKKELEKHILGMHVEYERVWQLIIVAGNRKRDRTAHKEAPIVPANQNASSSSSSRNSKKKKVTEYDHSQQSTSSSTSFPTTSAASAPPTVDGPPKKKQGQTTFSKKQGEGI
ncbi:unnamed protein product [Caenorhabditis brenneri]